MNSYLFSLYDNLLEHGIRYLTYQFALMYPDSYYGEMIEDFAMHKKGITAENYQKWESTWNSKIILKNCMNKVLAVEFDETKNQILQSCISDLNFYINKLNNVIPIKTNHAYIIEDLEKVKNDLQLRFGSEVVQSVKMQPKIKWLGNINVLATLIYELKNGQLKPPNRKTQKLIDATYTQMKDLILNNFSDSEGNPLSEESIKSYLAPSKENNRADIGTRVEIEDPS